MWQWKKGKPMQTRNLKLIAIILIFAIPYVIAHILNAQGYLGTLQNKGMCVESSIQLADIMTSPPRYDHYTLHIVLDTSADTITEKQLTSGIQTLGAKSNLAMMHRINFPTSLNPNKIYLASPQQELMLMYPQDQVMDLVMDLKRLVKPVEKRV